MESRGFEKITLPYPTTKAPAKNIGKDDRRFHAARGECVFFVLLERNHTVSIVEHSVTKLNPTMVHRP